MSRLLCPDLITTETEFRAILALSDFLKWEPLKRCKTAKFVNGLLAKATTYTREDKRPIYLSNEERTKLFNLIGKDADHIPALKKLRDDLRAEIEAIELADRGAAVPGGQSRSPEPGKYDAVLGGQAT